MQTMCSRVCPVSLSTAGDITDSLSLIDHSTTPAGEKHALLHQGPPVTLRQATTRAALQKNKDPLCITATDNNARHWATPQSAAKTQTHLSSFHASLSLIPSFSFSSLWQRKQRHALHGVAQLNGTELNERLFLHTSVTGRKRTGRRGVVGEKIYLG